MNFLDLANFFPIIPPSKTVATNARRGCGGSIPFMYAPPAKMTPNPTPAAKLGIDLALT